jgi:ABC-type phosphate transport system substrate-binding protein
MLFAQFAHANKNNIEIVIVKNTNNPVKKISKSQLRNVFLGRNTFMFEPVIPPVQTITRIIFNTKIIGLNESRIQSFYAQMRFSGRDRPPKELPTNDDLLYYISTTQNAITYVPKGTALPDNVEIIYTIAL